MHSLKRSTCWLFKVNRFNMVYLTMGNIQKPDLHIGNMRNRKYWNWNGWIPPSLVVISESDKQRGANGDSGRRSQWDSDSGADGDSSYIAKIQFLSWTLMYISPTYFLACSFLEGHRISGHALDFQWKQNASSEKFKYLHLKM